MDNKEKKGKTRKEFLIDTSKGAFGVALGGFMWPNVVFGRSHTRTPKVLTNIAFGSCADQTKPQPIWDAIVDCNPDVFLGYNILPGLCKRNQFPYARAKPLIKSILLP